MAHQIDFSNGRANMASNVKTWHGLENRIEESDTLEIIAQKAGMTHRILRAKVRYATCHSGALDASSYRAVDDKVVLFRDDTSAPLGIVSDSYKVVQPAQVIEFFRDLVAKHGFKMSTAGCLFDGKKYWALAETGDSAFIVDKRDVFKSFLLLSTSADGSTATEARFTDVRVVCNNTMSMAIGAKANAKVTHRSVFKAEDVHEDLGLLATEAFAGRIKDLRMLAEKPLTFADIVRLTSELIIPGSSDTKEGLDKVAQVRSAKAIGDMVLNHTMIGNDIMQKHTAFSWLQAVTEYVDHKVRARNDENRLNSAWFGPGSNLKTRGLELALAG
jgi:phage/plasmid-like protein (TIGR03299 family)